MKKHLPLKLFLSGLMFLVLSNPVKAETVTSGLTISGPADETGNLSLDFSGDPGDTFNGTITVTNTQKGNRKIKTEVKDFIVESETGATTLVETDSTIWAMSLWTTVPQEFKEFTLEENESREVSFTLTIPEDATPGGHYAEIMFTPVVVQESVTGPLIENSIGAPIKLTVSGDITVAADITELTAPYFSEYGPIPLTLKVLNSGNTHIKTTGIIRIKNMFSQAVAEWNLKATNVFPTAIRSWDTEWAGKWRFGLYKAEVEIIYGSEDSTVTKEIYFWVIPWKVVLAISVVIIVLIWLGYYKDTNDKSKSKLKKEFQNEKSITSI